MKIGTFVRQMAVLSSFLLGAVLQTVAQPGPGGPGGAGGPGGPIRFELTAEQQTKVREASQASATEREQLNQKLMAAQKEAIAAALAEKPDEQTVRSKLEAITKLQTELGLLNFKNFRDVKFTDAQKEQLTSLPPLGHMVLFGGRGPGAMGRGFGAGAGRPGGAGAGGVNK